MESTNKPIAPTGAVQYALYVKGGSMTLADLVLETGFSVATTRKAIEALVATGVAKMVPVDKGAAAWSLTGRARTALSARVRRSL